MARLLRTIPLTVFLERFADPVWREVEAAWQGGRISSRECMARQMTLLRVTPEVLDNSASRERSMYSAR